MRFSLWLNERHNSTAFRRKERTVVCRVSIFWTLRMKSSTLFHDEEGGCWAKTQRPELQHWSAPFAQMSHGSYYHGCAWFSLLVKYRAGVAKGQCVLSDLHVSLWDALNF